MIATIENLQRKFIVEINNEKVELDDINPNLTPEEVMDIYSSTYPQLVNAKCSFKGIEIDFAVYQFSSIAGTKG